MRPHVIINMAMSVDGKVSSIAREPTTFTSREDKNLLQKIRSHCDAIVAAAGTITVEQATLSILKPTLQKERIFRNQPPHPIRVIISGSLNLSPTLPIFKKNVSPLLIICCETASITRRKQFAHLGHLIICGRREVNIPRLISILAKEYDVRTILCEGGPTLNDAFFRAKMVDELYITLCPQIVGGKTAPTLVDGSGVSRLKNAYRGKLISCQKGKREWFLRYLFRATHHSFRMRP